MHFAQLVIPPYYMAVMQVEVVAPDEEGPFVGEVILETDYEQLRIQTSLRTVEGCLGIKPDHVIMKPTFPVSILVWAMVSNRITIRNKEQGSYFAL